MKLESFR